MREWVPHRDSARRRLARPARARRGVPVLCPALTSLELALVLASALLHALWSASIKQSGDPLLFNVLQLPLVVLLLAALVPFVSLAEIPTSLFWLLPATAIAHAAYVYWMCRAFEHGDLSLVYPIARSTPAFLPFFAVPLLGEHISWGGAFGIAVVVSGIWLVHGASRWT
jgi:drug/metabolite transporter (DMT)-like permease